MQTDHTTNTFALALCVLYTQANPRCVSLVEINSETDFVGRSEPFQQLVKAAARAAAALLPQPPAAMQVQQLGSDQVGVCFRTLGRVMQQAAA
jgi:translation elongation factor EF-Ts